MTSKQGYELAESLSDYIGFTRQISETCDQLCKVARRLHKLSEDECNGHPANENPYLDIKTVNKLQEAWERRTEREQEKVEKKIHALMGQLPNPDDGQWKYEIQRDPRGAPITITPPDGRTIYLPGR